MGLEAAECLGVLSAAVLDVLGLVGDEAGELDVAKAVSVAGKRAVGRDNEIVVGGVGGGSEATGTVVNKDAQFRCEAGGFSAPVFDKRGGAHDEGDSW